MTMTEGVAADRRSPVRRRSVLATIAVASVVVVQGSLLYSQSRVLSRRENVLREREALMERMNDLAGRITTDLEKFMEDRQSVAMETLQNERGPGDDRPVVVLPLPE